MKTIAVVQSNYIPWKGYFDLINLVDEFILFDDMQYTRRDWRNRNRIKTPNGLAWLTIPVQVRGRYQQRIRDTQVSDPGWADQHWATLVHNYARTPYFREYREVFEPLYVDCREVFLSQINHRLIRAVMQVLGITTQLTWSLDYELKDGRTERLVSLCQQAGASRYVSGPSARAYMDETLFAQAGITVEYVDYSGYPEYPQLYPPFEHAVSILDLVFSVGPHAPEYMLSFPMSQAARVGR